MALHAGDALTGDRPGTVQLVHADQVPCMSCAWAWNQLIERRAVMAEQQTVGDELQAVVLQVVLQLLLEVLLVDPISSWLAWLPVLAAHCFVCAAWPSALLTQTTCGWTFCSHVFAYGALSPEDCPCAGYPLHNQYLDAPVPHAAFSQSMHYHLHLTTAR